MVYLQDEFIPRVLCQMGDIIMKDFILNMTISDQGCENSCEKKSKII